MPVFDLLTLNRAVQSRVYTGSFFLNRFFKKEMPASSATVEIDVVKSGGRKLAPIVSPIKGGVAVAKEGFESRIFKPPYLHPKTVITVKDLTQRLAGESPYAPHLSPEARNARIAAEHLVKLDDTIERRKEAMAVQAVVEGKISMKGIAGADVEIDFRRNPEHSKTLSGTSALGGADCNITELLRECKRLIAKNSGYDADTLILGHALIAPFFADNEIKAFFTGAGYNAAQLQGATVQAGVTYYGRIPEFGDIYSYNEYYYDEDTKESLPMVPDDVFVYGASAADNRLLHGAIQNMRAGGLVAMEKFVDTYEYDNGKGREISIESAPLPALLVPDAFVSVKSVK